MIHLITYFTNNPIIIECLKNNLKNKLINKIHLYIDTIESLNIVIDLNVQNKIKIILLENKIPDFSEIFNYIKDKLNNEICLVMNSNLYLLNDNNSIINELKDNIISYKCPIELIL